MHRQERKMKEKIAELGSYDVVLDRLESKHRNAKNKRQRRRAAKAMQKARSYQAELREPGVVIQDWDEADYVRGSGLKELHLDDTHISDALDYQEDLYRDDE